MLEKNWRIKLKHKNDQFKDTIILIKIESLLQQTCSKFIKNILAINNGRGDQIFRMVK